MKLAQVKVLHSLETSLELGDIGRLDIIFPWCTEGQRVPTFMCRNHKVAKLLLWLFPGDLRGQRILFDREGPFKFLRDWSSLILLPSSPGWKGV